MDLNQFLLALRARRKAFMLVLAATIVAAVAAALIMPKRYVATATLLVDARDEQSMSPGRLSARERSSYIQTQVELLTSPRVAAQAARELKLAQDPAVREAWEKDTGGAGAIDNWIASVLLEKLDIDTSVSNLVLVNYISDDPRFAARVANAFSKAYMELALQLRTEPTREAAEWFDDQLKILRTQVERAQNKLNGLQKQKGVLAADERLDTEAARLSALTAQLLTQRNATYDAVSRHQQAVSILASGASPESIPDVLSNTYINGLKTDLSRAEARLEESSAVLGQNHPVYKRTTAEIQGLREKLVAETKKLVAGLGNAVEQSRKREQELQAALDGQQRRIMEMKDTRVEMTAIAREVDSSQRAYDAVLARYMTNNIESRARQTNVALLAPAIEPLKPKHPKVGLITGLSVLMGGLLAAGVVYVLEMLDRRVRSRADLESRLAVPSLGRLSRWQPTGSRLLPAPMRAARALPNPW
ncbi:MAG: chain length determinant protein EpsF [Burkholderiales bacterium]|nr:chain length determinant protein EpsF [Burkholderiales bacterium]